MNEDVSDKIKEILGEFYPNYIVLVLDEEGEVQSRCTSFSVGRMLIKEAAIEFCDDNTDIIYYED